MSELELFHVLRESERDLTVLKMKVKGIENPIIGTVDRLNKAEIVLKPYTLYAEKLVHTVIQISKIQKIVKVHLHYSHLLLPMTKPQARMTFKRQTRRRAA